MSGGDERSARRRWGWWFGKEEVVKKRLWLERMDTVNGTGLKVKKRRH